MILLVDERPEEVTDFRMDLPEAEIYASSNDENIETHIRIADLAIERAKHLVESGKDVVLLMDSLTRLSRAHNAAKANSGRTMSGGTPAADIFSSAQHGGSREPDNNRLRSNRNRVQDGRFNISGI